MSMVNMGKSHAICYPSVCYIYIRVRKFLAAVCLIPNFFLKSFVFEVSSFKNITRKLIP